MTSSRRRGIRWAVVAVIAAAALGSAYALWQPARLPSAFCRPIIRVIGVDVNALILLPRGPAPQRLNCVVTYHNGVASSQRCYSVTPTHPQGPTLASPVAATLLRRLHRDISLALTAAPNASWRAELSRYARRSTTSAQAFMRGSAVSSFSTFARTRLAGCGVSPLGVGAAPQVLGLAVPERGMSLDVPGTPRRDSSRAGGDRTHDPGIMSPLL